MALGLVMAEELVEQVLAQPLVMTAVAMAAFAYLSALLWRVLEHVGQRPSGLVRFGGTVLGLGSCYMAWRSGIVLSTCVVCTALLLNSPMRPVSSSASASATIGLVGLRMTVALAVIVALIAAYPMNTVFIHDAEHHHPADVARVSNALFAGAHVRVFEGFRHVAAGPLIVDYDKVHLELAGLRISPPREEASGATLDRAVVIALHGSDVSIDGGVVLGGVIIVTGARNRILNLRASPAVAVHASLGTRFINITKEGAEHVDRLTVDQAACLNRSRFPWLTCLRSVADSETEALSPRPSWLVYEDRVPAVVALFTALGRGLASGASKLAVLASHWGGRAAVSARAVTIEILDYSAITYRDVHCAISEGLSIESLAVAATFVSACAPTYPVLHSAVFHSTVLTWAVGVPTAWRTLAVMFEYDCRFARQTLSWASHLVTCLTPLVSRAWNTSAGLATIAGLTLGRVVPEAADFVFSGYAEYCAWYLSKQRFIATNVLSALWAGTWVGASALWIVVAAVSAAWGWYTVTTLPSHVAVAAMQTGLIGISYIKEARVRVGQQSQGGKLAAVLSSARWTAVAGGLALEDGGPLLVYAATHFAATLVVFGASFIGFLPLVKTATLHVGFPVASTWALMQIFPNRRSWTPLILLVKGGITLVFEVTIGDLIYRLVSEVLKPLFFATIALTAAIALRKLLALRRRVKPKSE